jgi:hypothetical protein
MDIAENGSIYVAAELIYAGGDAGVCIARSQDGGC